jgi:hypothetical protein
MTSQPTAKMPLGPCALLSEVCVYASQDKLPFVVAMWKPGAAPRYFLYDSRPAESPPQPLESTTPAASPSSDAASSAGIDVHLAAQRTLLRCQLPVQCRIYLSDKVGWQEAVSAAFEAASAEIESARGVFALRAHGAADVCGLLGELLRPLSPGLTAGRHSRGCHSSPALMSRCASL